MTALGAHWPGSRPVPELVAELRQRRIKAGLSQRALAKKAGVAEGTIAHMERGAETPRAQNLVFIARALGREMVTAPVCPHARALEAAEWLLARGWVVVGPNAQKTTGVASVAAERGGE